MAGNIIIPNDLTKVVEVTVKDTSDTLRRFLIDLATKQQRLEERIAVLEAQSGP